MLSYGMQSIYPPLSLVLCLLLTGICADQHQPARSSNRTVMPSQEHPRYWSWDGGDPVLLLGASNNDNLFQSPDYREQLRVLKKAGGNYVRCTMSSRDEGNDWPYAKDTSGRGYDLSRFNPKYWKKFHEFLREAAAGDIVVQIELWDRFDYSRTPWRANPLNPTNHAPGQLTLHPPPGPNGEAPSQRGLLRRYPAHPSRDQQPFFHSIPGMPLYHSGLDQLRSLQEAYIDTLLSISLEFGNVLYCINNETTTPAAWGKYWANYLRQRARAAGKTIYVTDMFDGFHHPASCPDCQRLLRDTTNFDFIDVSQINSRHFGKTHWDTLRYLQNILTQLPPRPVNSVKVYGGGETAWGSGTNLEGIRRFHRNVIGGLAAVRHHRPPTGNGLNTLALNSIRAVRTIEQNLKFWDLEVVPDGSVVNPEFGEAYTARTAGGDYLIYFPGPGRLDLNLPKDQPQVAYAVSVIGFLGTQRKEMLTPPYDPSFSIYTDEEKGGWMLLKRLD